MPLRTKRQKKKDRQIQKSFVDILGSDDFDEYINFIKSPRKTFFFNFLRGTGFGLGTILGTAVILSLILYVVGLLGGLPIVGEYVRNIVSHINLSK